MSEFDPRSGRSQAGSERPWLRLAAGASGVWVVSVILLAVMLAEAGTRPSDTAVPTVSADEAPQTASHASEASRPSGVPPAQPAQQAPQAPADDQRDFEEISDAIDTEDYARAGRAWVRLARRGGPTRDHAWSKIRALKERLVSAGDTLCANGLLEKCLTILLKAEALDPSDGQVAAKVNETQRQIRSASGAGGDQSVQPGEGAPPPPAEQPEPEVAGAATASHGTTDLPEPATPSEATHEVFGTAADRKAPWLALRDTPPPQHGSMLARLGDGVALEVIGHGVGPGGQWLHARVASGEHAGTEGYVHQDWVRLRAVRATCPPEVQCPAGYAILYAYLDRACRGTFTDADLASLDGLRGSDDLVLNDLVYLFNLLGALSGYRFKRAAYLNTFYYDPGAVRWLPPGCVGPLRERKGTPRSVRTMMMKVRAMWKGSSR